MKEHHSKENRENNVWQIQEAKAKFSRLVDDANKKGYQTITKQGEPVAIILSKKEFDKITKTKATSFINFFKAAPCQEVELDTQRSKDLPREFNV